MLVTQQGEQQNLNKALLLGSSTSVTCQHVIISGSQSLLHLPRHVYEIRIFEHGALVRLGALATSRRASFNCFLDPLFLLFQQHLIHSTETMVAKKQKRSRKYRVCAACQSPPTPSLLLELPAELRNRIYAFALTEPQRLALCWQPGVAGSPRIPILTACGSDAHPINQIKYVNRQTYQEIAGVELQYNKLTVVSQSYTVAGAIAGLLKSLRLCTPKKVLWMCHQILLKENFDCGDHTEEETNSTAWLRVHMQSVVGLLKTCALHSHLRVQLAIPGFDIVNDNGRYLSRSFLITGI